MKNPNISRNTITTTEENGTIQLGRTLMSGDANKSDYLNININDDNSSTLISRIKNSRSSFKRLSTDISQFNTINTNSNKCFRDRTCPEDSSEHLYPKTITKFDVSSYSTASTKSNSKNSI